MPRFINDTSEDRDGGAAGLSKHAATDQQLGQKVEEGQGQGCSLQAEIFRYTGADAAMSDKQSAMSHGFTFLLAGHQLLLWTLCSGVGGPV